MKRSRPRPKLKKLGTVPNPPEGLAYIIQGGRITTLVRGSVQSLIKEACRDCNPDSYVSAPKK